MGNPLFDRRSPRDWAKASQPIVFDEKVASFERLAESLTGTDRHKDALESAENAKNRHVLGELQFSRSAFGPDIAALGGHASVIISLTCQRCLQAMEWQLEASMSLLLASEGEAPSVDQDVWEIESDRISPVSIVDEALVMALPLVAKHDDESCSAGPVVDELVDTDITRPFADLRAQMEKKT